MVEDAQASDGFDIRTTTITVTRGGVRVSLDVEEVDGAHYFPLRKKDTALTRLLLAGTELDAKDYRLDAMPRTTIFERLKALKNAEYMKRMSLPITKDGKRFKASETKLRFRKLRLPETIEIDAPTVGHVEGVAIKAKLDNCKQAISVEVTSKTLTYLSKCLLYQARNDTVKRKPNLAKHESTVERPSPKWKGVYNSYNTRPPLRACYKPPNGKIKTLYTHDEEAAVKFAMSGKRPQDTAIVEEDDDGTNDGRSIAVTEEDGGDTNDGRSHAELAATEEDGDDTDDGRSCAELADSSEPSPALHERNSGDIRQWLAKATFERVV